MKVLVINPIMYTSETKNIKRAASIKDTMMYDFCLAFHEMGHSITLVGGEPFKPTKSETYPFEVLWWECKCQKVCMPHCLPFMPETYRYVKQHRADPDKILLHLHREQTAARGKVFLPWLHFAFFFPHSY